MRKRFLVEPTHTPPRRPACRSLGAGRRRRALPLLGENKAKVCTSFLGAILVAFFFSGIAIAYALPNDYAPETVGAGRPEVHIRPDGTMILRSAKVEQILSTTLFLTTRWGTMPLRWTMKTDNGTSVVKRYGGSARVADIKLGDYLDVEGDFFVGSDFFGLTAKSIKDWSLTEESETFSGRITEANPSTVILQTPLGKAITVRPATSTAITKGAVNLPWSRLAKGDTVLLADGVYDYANNTLTASRLIIFQQKTEFTPRNFEGVLKRIEGTAIPATLVVTIGGADYTVSVSAATQIMSKNRKPAVLGRFVVGDTVRFYGALQESDKTLSDQLVVPAEIVRNLNL